MLVSNRLDGFKSLGNDIYNMRCPICMDSKKNKHKKRGFIYDKKGKTRYACHNCGANLTFYQFLEHIDSNVFAQFKMEMFKSKSGIKVEKEVIAIELESSNTSKKFSTNYIKNCKSLIDITENDELYSVKEYCINRGLPLDLFSKIYATNNINNITKLIPKFAEKDYPVSMCMVLPFYKKDNSYDYIQCRSIEEDCPDYARFLTLEINPDSVKLWGEFRINWEEPVYVLEGAIDAMFITNSVAMAGASVNSVFNYIKMKQLQDNGKEDIKNIVVCMDNDYKSNPQILKLLKKRLTEGYSVVIYDKEFKWKDINDAVIKGNWSQEKVNLYIKSRTFNGLRATLELSKLK